LTRGKTMTKPTLRDLEAMRQEAYGIAHESSRRRHPMLLLVGAPMVCWRTWGRWVRSRRSA
jgi:hypothetical protein